MNGDSTSSEIKAHWAREHLTEAILDALREAGKDLDALRAAAQKRDFKPVPLGVTISIALENEVKKTQTANVIGRLKGLTGTVDRSDVSLPAGDSTRFDFLVERSAGATPIRMQTYVVVQGPRTYLITCATSPGRLVADQASFDGFVRSFTPIN